MSIATSVKKSFITRNMDKICFIGMLIIDKVHKKIYFGIIRAISQEEWACVIFLSKTKMTIDFYGNM